MVYYFVYCQFTSYNQTFINSVRLEHYIDVIMTTMASQITSLTVLYSTVYSDADQRKHQSSASLAFVWKIHQDPGEFPAQMASYADMFPFDDVIRVSSGYWGSHIGIVSKVKTSRIWRWQRIHIIFSYTHISITVVVLWGLECITYLSKLHIIQKRIARMILGRQNYYPSHRLFK